MKIRVIVNVIHREDETVWTSTPIWYVEQLNCVEPTKKEHP